MLNDFGAPQHPHACLKYSVLKNMAYAFHMKELPAFALDMYLKVGEMVASFVTKSYFVDHIQYVVCWLLLYAMLYSILYVC